MLSVAWSMVLLDMMIVQGAVPGAAQGTYSVFPVMPSTAQPTPHDTGAQVTLVVHDSTVHYVVEELTRQAHMQLLDDSSDPLLAKRISVHVVNVRVMDALATVLKGTGLVATIAPDGETVVIRARVSPSPTDRVQLAAGIVVGRVTDSASGQGLGGALVHVEGTTIETVTSDSGNFTLQSVPAGDQVLRVRLFGYRPVERTVTVVDSQRTTVRIVMVPVPTVLSGVITTATGQTERYKVGNDITVLNADSIQQIAPVSNITQMLETRVPGLIVQNTTGIPGAPSRLRLRGLSTINGSADPILIIDGVRVYSDQSSSLSPSNYATNGAASGNGLRTGGGSSVGQFAGPSALDQIDPNSIETIEVLKGPSATAIYGSDAANGVIIVTTKHGRAGPTHWDLSLDDGRTTLPGSWPTNYFIFCRPDLTVVTSLCQYPEGYFTTRIQNVDSIVPFQALDNPRYSPLTGQPGQNRDASLTVSGGSGALTYSVTGSASSQSGYLNLPPFEQQRFAVFHGFPAPSWMVTPDQYATYGGSSQLTVQLGKTGATLSLSSQLFHSAQQQSSLQNDLANLSTMYVDTLQLAEQPLFPDYYTRAQLNTTTTTNALTLNNWSPWRWLPITATVGLNIDNQNNNTLLPRDYITCAGNVYDSSCGTDSLGDYAISQGANTTGSLTAGTTLLQGRRVSTAIGINVYTQDQTNFSASTNGLPIGVSVPTSFCLGVFSTTSGCGSYSTVNTATYGWYVQPTLNLNSRFFVSPGFRLDGGSSSGTNASFSTGGGNLSLFPKVDLSWLAVNRPPSNPMFGALTLLRPRIAFGIAGIQPGPTEQLRLLEPKEVEPLTSGGSATAPIDILQVQTLGNIQLHPERDQELEGGFDAQFWNQRLSLTLTGYDKTAYDAILSIPVAPSISAPFQTDYSIDKNIGTIRNTGMEATSIARLFDSRLVDWSVNANVARNRNLLVSLLPGQPPIVSSNSTYSTRLTPGYPLFGLWAKPVVGFSDANDDGLIEPSEVVVGDSEEYVGAQQPNYELTLSTTVAFFNDRLSISTSIDYQNGLTQIQPNGGAQLNLANPTLTPVQQAAIAASYSQTAIGLMQTVNTLRWNTLSVNYLVPPRMARVFHVPSLSLALQGSNLALHTNYRGIDPNVDAFSSGNLTEDDGNVLPQPRVWNLRVSLGT